jgi:hypothetical protein
MGYNTAAIILNDGMDQLKKDPDTGKKIHDGILMTMQGPQTIPLGNHCNPVMLLPSRHADEDQIVIVGGNYIRTVCNAWGLPHRVSEAELQEAVMRHLAQKLGYSLRKL